jgi:Fe-S-cluster-containing dehydrogenase component
MRGFLFDLNRCTGCHACLLACTIENRLAAGESWREVHGFNPRHYPGIARYHLSLGCLHCAEPACMIHCPARAYSRDAATGAVLIDPERCIGCRYCDWACPFDAPKYSRLAGTMSKCTLCNERLTEGLSPACCALCPTGALQFGDLAPAPGSEAPAGFPRTELVPSIRFTPPRSVAGPDLAWRDGNSRYAAADAQEPLIPSKLSIESDWPLIAFTLAAALLSAIAGAALTGPLRLNPVDFLAAGLGALGLSALHLGRRGRAWRALLNLRTSWLSREIAAYLVFLALYAASALVPAFGRTLGWASPAAGFATLYCIDRVYGAVSRKTYPGLHSGAAVLSGIFLFGVIAHNEWVAGLTGLARLVLYAERQPWSRSRARRWAALLRLGAGFVLPLALWTEFPDWVLAVAMVGEVIDRCEYYLDLDIPSPRSRLAADLDETLRNRVRTQPDPEVA